jgi:hypothetical protein
MEINLPTVIVELSAAIGIISSFKLLEHIQSGDQKTQTIYRLLNRIDRYLHAIFHAHPAQENTNHTAFSAPEPPEPPERPERPKKKETLWERVEDLKLQYLKLQCGPHMSSRVAPCQRARIQSEAEIIHDRIKALTSAASNESPPIKHELAVCARTFNPPHTQNSESNPIQRDSMPHTFEIHHFG